MESFLCALSASAFIEQSLHALASDFFLEIFFYSMGDWIPQCIFAVVFMQVGRLAAALLYHI